MLGKGEQPFLQRFLALLAQFYHCLYKNRKYGMNDHHYVPIKLYSRNQAVFLSTK